MKILKLAALQNAGQMLNNRTVGVYYSILHHTEVHM